MKNPFDFFGKTYCINLEERTDRWKSCLSKFEKYQIDNVERIDGVKKYISSTRKINGRYGCTASWEKTLRKIVDNDIESALVLEDDFEFRFKKDYIFEKVNNCISELPNDWDMLYLGGILIDTEFKPPIKIYSKNLYKLMSSYSTHSIAVSNKGANKILNYFKKDWTNSVIECCDVIDVFFTRKIIPYCNCFISNELLCTQEKSNSDIQEKFVDIQRYMLNVFEEQKNKIES